MAKHMVTLPDGERIPSLGQGTWYMGDDAGRQQEEIESLRLGVSLGMTLIDTAEMYGEGASERLVGKAVAGTDRKTLFWYLRYTPGTPAKKISLKAVTIA